MKKCLLLSLMAMVCLTATYSQSVGFNATGANPDPKAMLDIASTKSGLLIPRMTTSQRDSIVTPPNSLQIYNLTTNTIDVYRNNHWESVTFTNPVSNQMYVYSLADLPAPSGSSITLDANKMYIVSGFVNISPYYLNLNGSGIKGTDPSKDGILSTVSGGILRSTDLGVLIQQLTIIPLTPATSAYDFSDATGTQFCTFLAGAAVSDNAQPSSGVGQISGFKTITFINTFWDCTKGLKVTGNVGRFAASLNYFKGITSGAGIEFLSGLNANDIDISNNYFIYSGQTGIKVDSGSVIARGRMSTNMFRGVTTYLSGFDSYTPEWEMRQNTYIPNSRAFCFTYMNNNATSTSLPAINTFYKIGGVTIAGTEQRFKAGNNKLTYLGKELLTAKVVVVIGAKSPGNNDDFTIAIAKNGVVVPFPNGSMAPSTNNESFQITLVTEMDMNTNDYLEVFVKTNNSNTATITVNDMQFRISD